MTLVVATFVLGACGSEKAEPQKEEPTTEVEDTEVEEEQVETSAEGELVEVIIPADFAYGMEEEPAMQELFDDITTNDDGSVTYTIDETLHEEFVTALAEEFDVVIDEIVNTYPSFQLIEYTESYDEFDVHMDGELVEEADVAGLVSLVALAGTYNGFAGIGAEDITITVNMVDAATEEVVETLVYPE